MNTCMHANSQQYYAQVSRQPKYIQHTYAQMRTHTHDSDSAKELLATVRDQSNFRRIPSTTRRASVIIRAAGAPSSMHVRMYAYECMCIRQHLAHSRRAGVIISGVCVHTYVFASMDVGICMSECAPAS
jgi:hypothetical protein